MHIPIGYEFMRTDIQMAKLDMTMTIIMAVREMTAMLQTNMMVRGTSLVVELWLKTDDDGRECWETNLTASNWVIE